RPRRVVRDDDYDDRDSLSESTGPKQRQNFTQRDHDKLGQAFGEFSAGAATVGFRVARLRGIDDIDRTKEAGFRAHFKGGPRHVYDYRLEAQADASFATFGWGIVGRSRPSPAPMPDWWPAEDVEVDEWFDVFAEPGSDEHLDAIGEGRGLLDI